MFRDFPTQVKVLFSNFHTVKIADNKVNAVFDYAIKQLKDLYPENEVRSMIKLALIHYFNFDGKYLALHPEQRFTESELLKFVFLVKELKKGIPIQYALGECIFYNLPFKVNESVLIPRPETEELVDWIIREYRSTGGKEERSVGGKEDGKILDIGTGSGCIAIALKKNTGAEVYACDKSDEALAVAEQNAVLNSTEITFIQDDILNADFEKYADNFNVIVSNPPYVLDSEKELLHQNVMDHEPHTALFVEDYDALIFYKAIAEFALKKLKKEGFLYFEINEAKGDKVKDLLKNKGFSNIEIRKDLSGKDRMVKARKS